MFNFQKLPVSYIQIALRALANEGVSAEQILTGTQLTASSLSDGAYISVDQFVNVILNTRKVTNNPAIGLLLGSLLHPSTHGHMGWAAINSPALSDAITIFQTYSFIRTPFILYRTSVQKDQYIIRLTLTENLKDAHSLFVEAMLMLLQHIIEFILGRPMSEAKLYINGSAPSYKASYSAYFHCPVYFDSDHIEIHLPLALKDTINPNADSHMYQLALEQCQEAAHQLQREQDISTEIYDYLSSNLGTPLSLEQTAQHLNLSTRTVIRKLKQQHTSFQAIKDNVYAFQASNYLRRSSISVDTLSVIFGYSDPANFRRSFKRWFGVSPQQYRNKA